MNEWFGASELAGLPGMPTSLFGVRKKAQTEQWAERERSGRGGSGREYHIQALPKETRVAIAARQVSDHPEAINGEYAAGQVAVAPIKVDRSVLGFNASDGDDAKLWLLDALNRLRDSAGCSWEHAVQAYNDGQLQAPAWVRDAYPTTSYQTVDRWQRQFRKNGAQGLKSKRGNRKGQNLIDTQPDLRAFVLGMITQHPHLTGTMIHEAAETRFRHSPDIRIPHVSSLRRWIDGWKKDNRALFAAITNPDDYKNRFMTAFGDADGDIVRLNQRWEIDSTPADVMLVDGRHCLIGIMDLYSRRMMILVAPTSKAEAVCLALRKAILAWGVPELLLTDNGSDYVSRYVLRVLRTLEIEHDQTTPFSGWEKPHVERCFRTISHDVFELAPGFIGHNVSERAAIEARKSFAERLFKKDAVIEAKMTGAELQQLCDEWCENRYHRRVHSELGCTPFERATEWSAPVQRIEDERVLDLLLSKAPGNDGRRTVVKKGIRHDNAYFIAPELALHVGEQVQCLCDPSDLGRLYVFHEDDAGDWQRLCVAECPERLGFNPQEVAAQARKMQSKAIQEARAALKASARELKIDEVLDEIRAKDREAQGIVAFPGRSETHETSAIRAAAEHLAGESQEAVDPNEASQQRRKVAAEIIARRENNVETLETPRQRYNRWRELENTLISGGDLTDEDREFHRSYAGTEEWYGQDWSYNKRQEQEENRKKEAAQLSGS